MSTFLERLNRLDAQERTILTHLRYGGPATRQHLQERLGLSSSSMARITGTLVSEGFIEAVGEAASGGGRKAVLYGMGQNHGMLVGVELSRTEVRVRFTRPTLEPVDQFLFPLTNRDDPKKTVCRITEGIRKTLSRLGLSPAEIPGVGLGTAGQVARDSGMLRDNAGYLHEAWQGVPLARMMSEALGLPVFADNGANMAVWRNVLPAAAKAWSRLHMSILAWGSVPVSFPPAG
jgi:DNA-binding Lrp family transcriptional regulator